MLPIASRQTGVLAKELEKMLLAQTSANGIKFEADCRKILMLDSDMLPKVCVMFDLHKEPFFTTKL